MTESEGIGGPFVVAALFCDRLLREADDTVSLIRIVDRFSAAIPDDASVPIMRVDTSLFVVIKAANYTGPLTVRVDRISPDGTREEVGAQSVDLASPVEGLQLTVELSLGFRESGVHWFDIIVNGASATKTPMKIELLESVPDLPESTPDASDSAGAGEAAEPDGSGQ